MTPLQKLQEIARAATPGPWEYEWHEGEALISGQTDGHKHFVAISHHSWNGKFIATFNPRLIEKLLAEIKSGRKAMNAGRRIILRGVVIPDSAMVDYVQAREALDRELSPNEEQRE